jgi:TPR repeat protein
MLRAGEGVARDGAAAAEWYRKAAVQGHADAQYALGVTYDTVEGDHAAAARWYRKAAAQGHTGAQCQLGAMDQSHLNIEPQKVPK